MSTWVSAAPAIGTGSLDGFAAVALMSVVCAMAITAPRRARRPSAARGGAQAAEAPRTELAGVAVGSRHRRTDPIPGRAPCDGVSLGSMSEQSAFPGTVFPRIGFPGARLRREAPPGIVFPDAEVALVPFASARRPAVRRPPRHAAPSVGLGSRISGFGSRTTGLFATRPLASGARG